MGTLIRAVNLAGVEELMAELGGDARSLLARNYIDPALISDPDAYVSYPSLLNVLEGAAIECQCPDFGLRLAHWQGLGMLGPVAVMARNANNVLDAFCTLGKYLYVHGPALKFSLQGRNQVGDYCFNYRIDEPGMTNILQGYELSIANGAHILRMLAGPSARPARVYFMHAPLSSRTTYTRAFGCPVEFNAEHCGFDLTSRDMQRPLPGADAHTRQMAQRFLESSHPSDSMVSDRVAELIHRLLSTGQCSLTVIAAQLAMHPRSLQRALSTCDTSYEILLDEIRRQKARQYIVQTTMRFSQVAGLLGYSDQSTFNRACRRWFGSTPKDIRKKGGCA